MSVFLCPNCQTDLSGEFGMVVCLGCNQFVFVTKEEAGTSEIDELGGSTTPNVDTYRAQVIPAPESFETIESSESPNEIESSESPNEMDEVVVFANSNSLTGWEGRFFYDLLISEIDSRELEHLIREVLLDQKLALDVDRVWSGFQNGSIELKNLNPAKACVILNRIRSLSVEICWIQHDLSGSPQ